MALTPKKALGAAMDYTDKVALGEGAVQIPGPQGPSGRQIELQTTADYSFMPLSCFFVAGGNKSLFKFSARVGFCGKFDAPQGKNMQFY